MIFQFLAEIIEMIAGLALIYMTGIILAQCIKLLPLLFALSETLRWHRTFPVQAYLDLRTLTKMAPYRLFNSSVDYVINQLFQEGIAHFLGSLLGLAIFWFILMIGVIYGLFYFRLRNFFIFPVRIVYNLN